MMAAAGTCFSPVWPQAFAASDHAERAQPLAAAADDVLRHLVDQHDVAGQTPDDGLVDALEVSRD